MTDREPVPGEIATREKVVRELADALREMTGDGSQGTICHLPFEGVVGLIRRAYDAGRAEGQRAELARTDARLQLAVGLLDEIIGTAGQCATRSVTDQYLAAYVEPRMAHLRGAHQREGRKP